MTNNVGSLRLNYNLLAITEQGFVSKHFTSVADAVRTRMCLKSLKRKLSIIYALFVCKSPNNHSWRKHSPTIYHAVLKLTTEWKKNKTLWELVEIVLQTCRIINSTDDMSCRQEKLLKCEKFKPDVSFWWTFLREFVKVWNADIPVKGSSADASLSVSQSLNKQVDSIVITEKWRLVNKLRVNTQTSSS